MKKQYLEDRVDTLEKSTRSSASRLEKQLRTSISAQQKTLQEQESRIQELESHLMEAAAKAQFAVLMQLNVLSALQKACISSGVQTHTLWIKFGENLKEGGIPNPTTLIFPTFKKSRKALDVFDHQLNEMLALISKLNDEAGPF